MPLGLPTAPVSHAPATPAAPQTTQTGETRHSLPGSRGRRWQIVALLGTWVAVYGLSLFGPPLLDDADATHAQAAQAMLRTGDLVTLHVNGIRYLEKAPLPYWLTAGSLRLFGMDGFAVHLPLALTVLGLATLAWCWAGRVTSASHLLNETVPANSAFYAALFLLTAWGPFLFTRVFIPDALLSLLLALGLYAGLRALQPGSRSWPWASLGWAVLAAAVLTKGLVALVFLPGTFLVYLALRKGAVPWRRLHPFRGVLLLLLLAAPWHLLAGLRNRGPAAGGHGFWWFYFINEHVLRFLGRRNPPDYNRLPPLLFWVLHLVWLFPWSFFLPLAIRQAWRGRHALRNPDHARRLTFSHETTALLGVFSLLVLVFFSFSTNQEYYTFPVYLPLLLLTAAALKRSETVDSGDPDRLLLGCQWSLTAVCVLVSAVLLAGLWSSRHFPAGSDIGDLMAHRGVGHYTLSLSHFFDLTGRSFAALRLPAILAICALAAGSLLSLRFRLQGLHQASTLSLAAMGAVFLLAAHLALVRFGPLLSSEAFARRIRRVELTDPNAQTLLYGDQALGSSIPFYLGHPVFLVEGRSTSMLFGSTFPDAPPIFLSRAQLLARWGAGPRKLLFVPAEHRAEVEQLLGPRAVTLYRSAGKLLLTDRALPAPAQATAPHFTPKDSRPQP